MPGENNLHQGQLLNSLPFLLSSFIGRERELAEVKQVLANHRLVTLTGTGGCGKTRLALKVAADMQEPFTDQVWLVELAALAEPALLPQTVALALGLREPAQGTWTDALIGYLHSRKTLIVLDNCEHLIIASATLVYTLLRICPRLSLLVTSREALGIDGEMTWLVPSLSLPPIQESKEHASPLSPEQLMGFDAIRLFVERTNDASTNFALTDQNATLVTRLCQRLDGIPLAIELAAARMQVLSLEQIVSRLDSSIRLLMRGKRSVLPRHQTLQATIDWSYDLLPENERLLFRRLSVFAGGFTLGAVEAICTGGEEGQEIEQDEVLDILSSLVNKSLVIVAERGEETRYRLFETVRQYAQEKLRGETAAIHWQHARFFAQITDRAEPELKSGRRDRWIRYLNKEYDNLRAALGWLRDHAGEEGVMTGEDGLHMAGNLAWFWYFRSYLSEGRQWLEDMLACTPDAPASRARAVALFRIGSMSWVQGDYSVSHIRISESVARWRAMGDKEGLAYALSVQGLVTQLHEGNQQLSRSLQEESLALFQEVGDTWGLALALYRLGDTFRLQQNDLESRAYFEESLILFRVVQDRWGIAIALQRLGMIASRQGNYAIARAQLEECLTIQRGVGDKWIIAQTLSGLAHIVQRQGEIEQARQLLEESLALFRDIGDQLGITLTSSQLSNLSKTAPIATAVEQLLSSVLERGTPPLRIFAFGQGRVYRAKDALSSSDWTYAKVRELFFYLVSHRSRTRDQIGLALWPDASAAQLRSAFHDTLYHLRLALGQPDWIIFSKRSYTFNYQLPYWFDVEAFEAQVNHARQLQAEIPAQAIRAWEQAIEFYQGDFLQDMPFGAWCFVRREDLRKMYQETLLTLGALYTAERLYSQAVEIYRQAIAHDHYLETAHRALMQCYTYMGEKSRALRHYQDLVKWLRSELAAQPDPETTALFEQLRGEKDLSYR